MKRITTMLAGLALIAACGGDRQDTALTSDSALARDLNLATQTPYPGMDSLSAIEQGPGAADAALTGAATGATTRRSTASTPSTSKSAQS